MGRQLSDSLKPSPGELRAEAWKLLEERSHASNRHVRRSLAQRAFELAQLAGQLEDEARKREGTVPAPGEPAA